MGFWQRRLLLGVTAFMRSPPRHDESGHYKLDHRGPTVAIAFLTTSHVGDRVGLLQAILFDYALPYEHGGEQVLRLRLTDFLLKNCAEHHRRAVLLVDEAQHLSDDLLEELRLM